MYFYLHLIWKPDFFSWWSSQHVPFGRSCSFHTCLNKCQRLETRLKLFGIKGDDSIKILKRFVLPCQWHFKQLLNIRLNSWLNHQFNTLFRSGCCSIVLFYFIRCKNFDIIVIVHAGGLVCHSWPIFLLRCDCKLPVDCPCLCSLNVFFCARNYIEFDLCYFQKLRSQNVIWS